MATLSRSQQGTLLRPLRPCQSIEAPAQVLEKPRYFISQSALSNSFTHKLSNAFECCRANHNQLDSGQTTSHQTRGFEPNGGRHFSRNCRIPLNNFTNFLPRKESFFTREGACSWRKHKWRASDTRQSWTTNREDNSDGEELAINVQNLTLTLESQKRKEVQILKGATLQVPQGELCMLLGPNGCGKSTLLKALAGLLKPDGGHLRITQPCSFVFQNPDHQVVMPTAGADVAFGLGRLHLPEDEVKRRVQEALEIVGMGDYAKRSVQTLSGGQKQRVAIAGALAERSRVLLLDELTTFLDEEDQVGVLEAVKNVVSLRTGVTALWVTHRLEELPFADSAAYMHDGKVVMHGAPSKIERYIGRLQRQAMALR